MASLIGLPTETIENIADHLQSPIRSGQYRPWPRAVLSCVVRKDLVHLCLTCSRLRNVVQPMIFQSLRIRLREPHGTTREPLKDTLAGRPMLFTRVKNIVFDGELSGNGGRARIVLGT
jgi:hypothetical protein